MLCLTVKKGEKVLFYLQTEHGEKLLGSVAAEKSQRIHFDFGPEVRILRAKADEKRRGELDQPTGAK
jgi:hypothetical protein